MILNQNVGQNEEQDSQASYTPTKYQDSSWELVGEFINQESFEPLGFQVINTASVRTDPMFADYGGTENSETQERFHGSRGGHYNPLKNSLATQEEEREEAQRSLDKLKADHIQELEQVRQNAFDEGRLSAIVEADERMKIYEERFAAVLEDVGGQITESVKGLERQACELAIEIAHKLIGEAVEINPEYIISIVEQAINLSGGAIIQTVRVSAQDHEFIKLLNLPKQFSNYDGTWNFERDDSVRSGCIVVTSAGEIDFQLEPAWERVRDKVVRVIAS